MSLLHLIIGALVFVIFLITGQYMRADFPDKELIEQELRMLMRSRHIYVLLSAIIHLMLGLYFSFSKALWRRIVQVGGSVLLISGTATLIWAFVSETYYLGHFSDTSRNGLYLTLSGTVLHVIGGVRFQNH